MVLAIFCREQEDVSDVKPAQHFPLLGCYFLSPGLKEKNGQLVFFQIHHIEFMLDSLLALPAGSTFPFNTNYEQRTYFWLCMLLLGK